MLQKSTEKFYFWVNFTMSKIVFDLFVNVKYMSFLLTAINENLK